MMILKILRFEIKERFKQPLYWSFFGLMAFQSIWFVQGSYKIYPNEATNMNGAALLYRSFAAGGIIMMIIIAMVTGIALYKDIQFKSAEMLYSTSIRDRTFFTCRFLSAYAINLILGFGLFVGMALTPYTGIGTPDKFGPMPWGQMLHGFFILTAPNLFIFTVCSICSLVFSRRISTSYLSVFFITLIFFVVETVRENNPNPELLAIIDPAALVYTSMAIDKLPAAALNYSYLALDSTFFLNRLLWVGGAFLALVIAYRKFSFKTFITAPSYARKAHHTNDIRTENKSTTPSTSAYNIDIPIVKIKTTSVEFLRKIVSLAVVEFKNIVRPASFKVVLFILALMSFLANLLWNDTYYIGSHHYLTSTMTLTRVSMGAWISIVLMIWTTELLFKDRVLSVWQLKDSLPIPTWVVLMSKFLAMSGVGLILAVILLVLGLISQTATGAANQIDWSLYCYDLFFYNFGWWTYIQMIAYVCFFAGVTGNRFATHGLAILYFFFNIVGIEFEIIEELRFTYPFVPGIDDYSQLNGYGIWDTASFWYFLMWLPLSVAFTLLAIYFWKRGNSRNLLQLLTFRGNQLGWLGKSLVCLSLAAFVYMQSFVVANVNELNNFEPSKIKDKKAANYEKKYKSSAASPQPKISGVDINLDFFPSKRRAEFQAVMRLKNQSGSDVESIYLNIPDFTTIQALYWNGKKIAPKWVDDELDYMSFDVKMANETHSTLRIKGFRQHNGFTQSSEDSQGEVTYNGSFLNIRGEILPVIGYNPIREILTNRHRVDLGLQRRLSRMSPVTDASAASDDVFAPDALWLTGKIIVSTEGEQTAFGPGRLKKFWTENNRNYFEFELEAPSPFNWFFGSATYSHRSINKDELKFHIYHNPNYDYTIELYKTALIETHDFIEENLGKYPHSELRLIEIPFYRGDYFSFPNSIAISEKEGWFAKTDSLDDKSYVVFTAASQMISHWVFQNIHISNVQGADMLRYALPECLALQVVFDLYGEEGADTVLDKKYRYYVRGRGKEPNVEPPLIYADGVDYLEKHKGTLELYNLSEKIGFENFNAAVVSWVKSLKDQPGQFLDFYQCLVQTKALEQVSSGDVKEIKRGFEKAL